MLSCELGEITGQIPHQGNCMTANNSKFICDHNNPKSIELIRSVHSSASIVPTLLIQNNKNIDFDPVKAVWQYWQVRKHTHMNTALFSFMNGSSISRQFFSD
jgi:hypothetical protein